MLGSATLSASATRRSLRTLRTAFLSLALAAAAVAGSAGTVLAWDATAFSPDDEQLLMALTNQDRASAGLNALVNDPYLHTKAEWRAQDMGDRNYFSHKIPPDNNMVFTYMQNDGYCFNVAGENIGLSTFGDGDATSSIEIAFMGSPTHRDNILGTWARIGVGAYKAADGRKLYAILFSIPCGVSVPAPTPVTTPAPVVAPTPEPVAPTPKPVAATPRPTAKPQPTAPPTTVPTATPLVTASPSATVPAATPSQTPVATPIGPTAGATQPADPAPGAAGTSGTVTSLRVHERQVSGGPIDSLFRSLFGGLFGW
jgi:uncharacterized protein YkwD